MKKKVFIAFLLCFVVVFAMAITGCVGDAATTPAKLETPANLQISDVTLTWNAISGASGYAVQIDNGTAVNIGTDASYIIPSLVAGNHTFKVQAKGDGTIYTDSDWSLPKEYIYAPVFTVIFQTYGAEGTADGITVKYGAEYGVLPNGLNKTGYTFMGWRTGENGTGQEIVSGTTVTESAAHTLYAKWVANTYTVNYDANGGYGITVTGNHVYDVSKDLSENGFIRDGYVFAGWSENPDGSGQSLADKANVKNLTEINNDIIILYAKWAANLNTVSFNANGGSGNMTDQKLLTDETAALKLNSFEKTGYQFAGWATEKNGDVVYSDGGIFTMTSENTVILYAKWTPVTNILIIFEKYDGIGDAEDIRVTFDAQYGLLPGGLTKTGYTFAGWWTGENGTGNKVENGTIVKKTSTHTLYAKWQPASNKVKFLKNQPTDSEVTGTTDDKEVFTGDSINLSPNNYSCGGYSFVGWNTQRDASGTSYSLGESFIVPAQAEEIIFYAVWERRTFTVYLDPDGGSVISDIAQKRMFTVQFTNSPDYNNPPTQTVSETQGVVYPIPIPQQSDLLYTYRLFSGWYYTPSLGSTPILYDFTADITRNIVLSPQFIDAQRRNNANDGYVNFTGSNNPTIYYNTAMNTSGNQRHGPGYRTYFVPLRSGTLTVSFSNTSQSTKSTVTVYTENGGTVGSGNSASMNFTVQAGRLYYILISDGTVGEGNIRLSGTAIALPAAGGKAVTEICRFPIQYGMQWGDFGTAERTDYRFGGWYTEPYGQGEQIKSSDYAILSSDCTLYAYWIKTIHDVTAQSGTGGIAYGSGSYKEETQVTVTAKENEGYEFAGWYDGGKLVSSDIMYMFIMPGGNITLIAEFTPLPLKQPET